MNFSLMKSTPLNYVCLIFASPKADGNASGFHKYPRADKIQTRSNPHRNRVTPPTWNELLNPSTIRKPSFTNPSNNSPSSRNLNQNLQQSNPKSTDLTMADSTAQTTSSTVHDAEIHGLKVIYGLIFQFSSAHYASETETLKHDTKCIFLNFWTSGVRHPSAASLQSKIFLSWPTNPWKPHRFDLLWRKYDPFCESKHRPEPLGWLLKSLA